MMFGLMRPYLGYTLAGLIALGVGSGVNLLFPELVRRILSPEVSQYVLNNIELVVGGGIALFALQGLSFFVRSYCFGVLGQRVYADLRQRLFGALVERDIAFFDANRASDIATRLNSDAALIQDAVSVKVSVLLRYGLQVVCGVVLMTFMSWQLTLAIVASIGLMVGVSGIFVSRLKSASRLYQATLGSFTSYASECFSGVKSLRALNAEPQVINRAGFLNHETLQAGERRVVWSASFSSGASTLLNVLLLLVAWYGITLVQDSTLPLNELAAFVLYGAIVAVSFSFFTNAYAEFMQSMGGLERVFELLHERGDADKESSRTSHSEVVARALDIPDSSVTQTQPLGIDFNDVFFSYPSRADIEVLSGFTCSIAPGSRTAIVGPSGAGKSSIAQLLVGLYEQQAGAIYLGDRTIKELSPEALHRLIAWVPQEPRLFGFTVLENLLLGNDTLIRDEALKIIQRWDFLDFIGSLEAGVDTKLGEHGALLSGGQRQRLAIAQAMLRNPSVLILDEATSGLDSDTEGEVTKALHDYLPDVTLLVISHRLSSVQTCDRIHVIEDGALIASGTHHELSNVSGLYQRYSMRQVLG
jgi:ABC-type multidrug transport system fused ATPase/permease subunit